MSSLAICGKIGSGKDTLAELIMNYCGKGSKIQFARALKQSSSIITGIEESEMYTTQGKSIYIPEFDMTLGRFLQKYGGLLRDHISPNIWVYPAARLLQKAELGIITDMRFPQEYEYLRKLPGTVILRIKSNRDNSAELAGRDKNDISEISLDYLKSRIIYDTCAKEEVWDDLYTKSLTPSEKENPADLDLEVLNCSSLEDLQRFAKWFCKVYILQH
jgi:hypothetical protein